jgi:hypothetical protein
MSHLFVLERMTAHIIMRGRNKFATPPTVLCSILLFHKKILKQKEEGHNNFFITCLCLERSERNGLNYEKVTQRNGRYNFKQNEEKEKFYNEFISIK